MNANVRPRSAFVSGPSRGLGGFMADAIAQALQETGFTVSFRDQFVAGTDWSSQILEELESAALVVADISDRNPTVMYELGFADALRKPTILLFRRNSAHELPSELVGRLFIPYESGDQRGLTEALKRAVRPYLDYTG